MTVFFGNPPGVHVGQQFLSRADLKAAFMHTQNQAGISGNPAEGSDAIVLSGGYPADEDYGDEILYTGHGGQNARRQQIANQDPEATGNAALRRSFVEGLPVRVIRGHTWKSPFSPKGGYRYAGLYVVTRYWQEPDKSGFILMRFKLERLPEQAEFVTGADVIPDPAYSTTTISRRIRDSALTRRVKSLYNHQCQICDMAIPGVGGGLYSEGAHVRPLGRPHLGQDALDNLLCLCPNHHTQLDIGGLIILDDFSIAASIDQAPFAELRFAGSHVIDIDNLAYHRAQWIAA